MRRRLEPVLLGTNVGNITRLASSGHYGEGTRTREEIPWDPRQPGATLHPRREQCPLPPVSLLNSWPKEPKLSTGEV